MELGGSQLAELVRLLPAHPAVRRDRARIEAAAAHVRAEQRLRWPTINADLAVNWHDPTLPATDLIGGLTFEAPVLSLRGGAIARAKAEQALEETTAALELRRLDADLTDAYARAQGAGARARSLATDVLPALEEVRRMTEEGYRDGRVDLLRLIDAQRARLDNRLAQSKRRPPGSARWPRSNAQRAHDWIDEAQMVFERGLTVAVLLAVFAGCHGREEAEAPAGKRPVRCAPVETATVEDTIELRGTVAPLPDRDAEVAPQVAGRIAKILVREGDCVAAGQPVARIDDAGLVDQANEAAAAVAKVEAERRNADATRARTERVFEHGIAARQEVEDATTRADTAGRQRLGSPGSRGADSPSGGPRHRPQPPGGPRRPKSFVDRARSSTARPRRRWCSSPTRARRRVRGRRDRARARRLARGARSRRAR